MPLFKNGDTDSSAPSGASPTGSSKSKQEKPGEPSKPPGNESAKAAANEKKSKVPLFNNPGEAVKLAFSLGLMDSAIGKPAWRVDDESWYGLANVVTFKGGNSKVGDVDNNITCMHSSESQNRVDFVRWTANNFNTEDSATVPKFKELCLAYVAKLGCQPPENLFVGVDPGKGQLIETPEATFQLERLAYKLGFGWQLTITGKTE